MSRFLFLFPLLLTLGCQESTPAPTPAPTIDAATTEAREDSLALEAAYAAQALIRPTVTAKVETTIARADAMADAADDPAIWVHPTDSARSLVYGSNKTGGLAVYDLEGKEVAYYPVGSVNNVDIIKGVQLAGETIDLLGCSNRSDQSIDLFRIDPISGVLTDVAAGPLLVDRAKIDDVYGFCFGRKKDSNVVYAIWNGKNGVLQQAELVDSVGLFTLNMVRELALPSQTEGMVTDDELGWLYVGEEAAGVWKLPLVPAKDQGGGAQVPKKLPEAMVGVNPVIIADVEGITLVETGPLTGYLVVSVQGNFSYAVFDRAGDNAYLGSFKISNGTVCDGVEETDGLEVVPDAFPGFPNGLFVAQDGFNYDGDTLLPQNFKYVDWGEVTAVLDEDK